MKQQFISRGSSRKGAKSFNPNSQFIQDAIQEYLKNGGKINQLQPDDSSLKKTWMATDISSDVDEFLIGQ